MRMNWWRRVWPFWDEGAKGIVLHRGEELNGLPRKYSTVLTYRKRPVAQQ